MPTRLLWDWLKKAGHNFCAISKTAPPKNFNQKQYTSELSSPTPRRDLYPRLGYLPVPTMIANSGCSNHWFYCVVNQSNYSRCVVRPFPEVVNEIKSLKARRIMFLDPNMVSDREYAKKLLQALISLNIRWSAPVPSVIVYDRELFDLFVRSGCEGVLIGFESFSHYSEVPALCSNDSFLYKDIL